MDTLTIIMEGEVPLGEFARTVSSFYELVRALSVEVGAPDLDWVLDDLQFSSAVATARASQNPESAAKVVSAYADVAHSLETGTPIGYSPRISSAAEKVISISDARVKALRFETPFREAVVRLRHEGTVEPRKTIAEPTETGAEAAHPSLVSKRPVITTASPATLGGLQGRVQVLSNRGGLRFTIYDLLYDKAVSCYVAEGKEELLRDVWGKLAVVEGMITRDALTGRPLAIRHVSNITPLQDTQPKSRDYEDARGSFPRFVDTSPEDAIRRLRDAQ